MMGIKQIAIEVDWHELAFEYRNASTLDAESWARQLEKVITSLEKDREELEELKRTINEVWMLAYPESIVETGKEKLRIFNLYQDLRDTRWNYRVLSKAYNEMDAKLNERSPVESKAATNPTGSNSIARSSYAQRSDRGRESRTEQSTSSNACHSSNGDR
jgi:hypothetical protein